MAESPFRGQSHPRTCGPRLWVATSAPVSAGPVSLDVAVPAHAAAHYHLLALFDLGREPSNAYNPTYAQRVEARRDKAAWNAARQLGRLHAVYRAAPGRHVLGVLPLAADDAASWERVCASLMSGEPDPEHPPLLRRALAPLADRQGRALLTLWRELLASEAAAFWEAHWLSGASLSGDDPAGMASYLGEHLVPLIAAFFGGVPQRVRLVPTEAIGARTYSLQRDLGEHRIAVSPVLKTAFYQVLIALVRARTDRLIRPFLPEDIRQRTEHPLNQQMRVDAALTVAHHHLQRHRPERLPELRAWALRQFENTPRQPQAAVEALGPMALIPAEAHPAVMALLDGKVPESR